MLKRLLGTQEDVDLITSLCANMTDTHDQPYFETMKGPAVSSTSRARLTDAQAALLSFC